MEDCSCENQTFVAPSVRFNTMKSPGQSLVTSCTKHVSFLKTFKNFLTYPRMRRFIPLLFRVILVVILGFCCLKVASSGMIKLGIMKRPTKSLQPSSSNQELWWLNRKLKVNLSKLMSRPIINPHNFTYIINHENTCYSSKTDFLFVIPSAPENLERRSKMRTSDLWHYVKNTSHHSKLLFFLGNYSGVDKHVQDSIYHEDEKFSDIIQEDFLDVYKNILLKAKSMLKWAKTFCASARYVIRVDDDATVEPIKIVRAITETGIKLDNFILGHFRKAEVPVRDPNSRYGKYYLSFEEYRPKYLPPFILGGMLGYRLETVKLLYEASLRVPSIWLDDVYVTGILSKEIGATLATHSLFKFKHTDPITNRTAIS